MKKAIIIGATSGIGEALTKFLVINGYMVGITGRRGEALESTRLLYPEQIKTAAFDATEEGALEKFLPKLVESLGGLDVLIISSGRGDFNPHLKYDIEISTLDLNVSAFAKAAIWAMRYFEQKGSGQLVGITSIAGIRGSRFAPAYNATKAFQINYLEGLRQRATHSKKPIYITDVRPGFVDTPMAKGPGMFWVAPVDKAVQQIFKAIQAKRKVVYITKRWRLISLLLKALPRWLVDKM